jgi:hypothetical protein
MAVVEPPAKAVAAPDAAGGLHRRALGVPDLVFFIVAASAPLTAVAGGQAVTYLVTGNQGIPLLFVPLGIVLAIFAVGYAAMSRHVADAGAFYTYVVRGLGRIPGVGAAFVALVAYNAMQLGIYGLFGVAMGAFAADKLGITMEWYWWCLVAGGIIAILGVLRRSCSASRRSSASSRPPSTARRSRTPSAPSRGQRSSRSALSPSSTRCRAGCCPTRSGRTRS